MDTRFKNVTTRTEKTSTEHTARKMVTWLINFISRRSMRKNVCTVTMKLTKKRTYVRGKKWIGKRKGKEKCGSGHSPWQAIFRRWHTCMLEEKVNHEIKEMFISDSGSTSHMVNRLNNIKFLWEVKTVVNTRNKKTMTVSFQGDWKGY